MLLALWPLFWGSSTGAGAAFVLGNRRVFEIGARARDVLVEME